MPFDANAVQDFWQCPQSQSPLILHNDQVVCVDPNCRLGFDIIDNIPVLLIDAATEIDSDDWSAIMKENGRNPETGDPVITEEQN